MDNPILNGNIYYHGEDSNNYYENNIHNSSDYDNFLNIDTHTGYLMIGLIIYFSCFCFRGLNRADRDTDLNVSLTQEQVVSPRVVEKIKNNKIDPKFISKESCCSICLEDFDETKDIIYLDCKHIYHEDCIIEWINKEPSCPLCRSNSLV